MEKKLPFDLNVEMRMYHNKSFPLGIIKANIQDYEVWLCNKLINCVYKNGTFDSVEEDIWSTREGLTFFQNMCLTPKTFAKKGLDLITFNKSMINDNFYVLGSYNEFYIPFKRPYKKYNFDHDYIIFGYDDYSFKSAAYISNNKYEFFNINYDDYLQGVVNSTSEKVWLNFYRINPQYSPEINIDLIKVKLKNYLNSSVDVHGWTYGIDAWDKLSEYILNCQYVDLRFSRAYMEYHRVMMKRFEKLHELTYIKDTKMINDYYIDVYLKTEIVHNLFIKYYLTQDKDLILKIRKLIINTNEKERELVELAVNEFFSIS